MYIILWNRVVISAAVDKAAHLVIDILFPLALLSSKRLFSYCQQIPESSLSDYFLTLLIEAS